MKSWSMRLFARMWLALPGLVLAHAGEDHGAPPGASATTTVAPSSAAESASRRLADGSVFVPKPAQRRLGVRTLRATPGEHAGTVELNGRVVADPGSAGIVQATQGGRVVAAAGGMPALGRRVVRDEVLAWLEPAVSPLERSARASELEQVRSQLALSERRIARLAQLEGVVPARESETAKLERDGLQARIEALGRGVDGREALRAPVTGVVAASEVVPGQVVAARQTLFEVVDPGRLAVEALAYDLGPIDGAGSATAWVDGATLPLAFAGAGRVLREGALPVRFRILEAAGRKAPLPLAINQPVKVLVETVQVKRGVAVPRDAVVRNAAGESVVWTHTEAEHFVPVVVKVVPLDGRRVLVVDGLAAGTRVVVQGAALLAQVR